MSAATPENCDTCKWIEKNLNRGRTALEVTAMAKARASHLQTYHHGQGKK